MGGWGAAGLHELLLLRGIDAPPRESPARNPEISSSSWSPGAPSALFSPPGELLRRPRRRWGRGRGGRHFPETANLASSPPPPPSPAQLRPRFRCWETSSRGRLETEKLRRWNRNSPRDKREELVSHAKGEIIFNDNQRKNLFFSGRVKEKSWVGETETVASRGDKHWQTVRLVSAPTG